MIRRLVFLYWKNIKGPKLLVLLMSFVVSLSHGLLLSIINDAVEARASQTLMGTHIVMFGLCMAFFTVGNYFTMYKAAEMTGHFMHSLRERITLKLTKTNLKSVEKYERGEIFTHLTSDVERLATTALKAVSVFQAGVLVLFCIGYLAWLSLPTLGVTLVAVCVGLAIYFWQKNRAERFLKKARSHEAEFFQIVIDKLDGFKELKINSQRDSVVLKHLINISDRFRHYQARSDFIFFACSLTSQLFLFAILAFIVFSPVGWLSGDATHLFKVIATLLFMLTPVEAIVDFIGPVIRAEIALNNIERLETSLETSVETVQKEKDTPVQLAGPLVFKNVTYTYQDKNEDRSFEIGPLNFQIKAGETTFICGGNGSGKTTLLKLITGLYFPDSGAIFSNGNTLALNELNIYRSQFSTVFYDFHLFHSLYGASQVPDGQISEMLIQFDLSDKTRLEDDRFSSLNLSTGQRKRLALITAISENRPIIVLDEFGADQDPEFRKYFYNDFLPQLKTMGKTVIAVTHDDTFFDHCDQLIKMDLGKIVSITKT